MDTTGSQASSALKKKNWHVPKIDLHRSIHFTKQVKPAMDEEEHFHRILNREDTPFVTESNALTSRFGPIKDKFVQKYECLLKQNERKYQIENLAMRSREYCILEQ